MHSLTFFTDIGLRGSSLYGDEAAYLADLVSAGVPVAPGFVLPSSSYSEFLSGKEMKQILAFCDPKNLPELRSRLMSFGLPARLISEIEGFYRSLSGPRDIVVSVRALTREERITNLAALLTSIKRIWFDHLASVCERGGNFYKEPLPIIIQQETVSDIGGVLFTSAAEFGGTDFCLVEVTHSKGKERITFEKGTGDVVKRTVSGLVDNPVAPAALVDLSNWASKIEQILGGVYLATWKLYRGEFVFEHIKKIYLPRPRNVALDLWFDIENKKDLTEEVESAVGFTCRDVDMAISLASQYPSRKILLFLDAADFNQLDKFREGRNIKGLKNLHLVLPPVRTADGLREMKRYLSGERIQRGPHLLLYFRAYYPANIVGLEQFLDIGVDGVIIDEEALSQGFLGTKETVEPDETILWIIKEASRKCRAAKTDLLYLGGRARSWILYELVRSSLSTLIISQRYQREYLQALSEAQLERLSGNG